MAVNYSLSYMSSEPGNAGAAKKYYAKAQASGEVTMDEMAEDIAYATTLTDGDALNALRAFITQVKKHLANGKIVRLENFGSFQIQLQSKGADTEDAFTSANITGTRIQFRPGNTIKAATRSGDGGLTFKRVTKLTATTSGGSTSGGSTGGDDGDTSGSGDNPLG
ncbi:MAG: HU family DNA-binding protein, partial [Bacteroides sp.]|nr:HU family DNA-binding protein [Bacteroides sp.]